MRFPPATGAFTPTRLPLAIAPGGRYLLEYSGNPAFVFGDGTAQTICQQSLSDVATFIANRKKYGVTAVWMQIVCNAQLTANATVNGATQDGIAPFTGTLSPSTVDGGPDWDFTTPNPPYFARQDDIIRMFNDAGMCVYLNVMDQDSYPQVYRDNGNSNLQTWGSFVGARYAGRGVVLLIGNDFQTWSTSPSDNALAQSIMIGIQSAATSDLQTDELNFNISGSSDNTLLFPYVNLSSAYTYFPVNYEVGQEYGNAAGRPVHLIESYYEGGSYGNLTPHTATNKMMRSIAYASTLCGALAGYFYGNNTAFGFPSGWQSMLDTVPIQHTAYWKALLTSLPNWHRLVPDTGHTVVTAGYGTASGNNTGNIDTDTYCPCARASDGKTVLAYLPVSTTLTVDMTQLAGTITARWYDPTTGTFTAIGSFSNTGTHNFASPGNNSAGDPDWVLVLTVP